MVVNNIVLKMKHMVISICIIGLASLVSGCTTNGGYMPVQTKAEARAYPLGEPMKLNADYLKLARYWDENSPKVFRGVLFPDGFSRLEVFEADSTAHLVCGDAFIHGLIELKGQKDGTTIMNTYAWGGDFNTVKKWRDMLIDAPGKIKTQ